MFMNRIGWGWLILVAGLAAGCGDSQENDDDDDDEPVEDFLGRWVATENSGTDSCAEPFQGNGGFEMELKEGDSSDLEYVEFDFFDPSKVACTQRFDVRDGVARLAGEQACDYETITSDPVTGDEIIGSRHVVYTSDRVGLNEDDTLSEAGASHYVAETGETCNTTFAIEFMRK
jgi:hypothetical protein